MTDPLSLFPMALAARGGRIDGLECSQLVAAGLTLLQRSAPLVRALSGKRSGILLPVGPTFLVALAASDGRGAVWVDPATSPREIARQLADSNTGAMFTTSELAERAPATLPLVLLDDAPGMARFVSNGESRNIDLGTHFGIDIEGSRDAEGLDEECVLAYDEHSTPVVRTHRQLVAIARAATPDSGPFASLAAIAATLIAGGSVTTNAVHPRLGRSRG